MSRVPCIRAEIGRSTSSVVMVVTTLLASLWGAAAAAVPLFASHVDYPAGSHPYFVAIGDLNGDAKSDLVVANANSNTVSVLLGNGNGTFGAKTDYGTQNGPFSVAIGDLNGDGKPDLAVADNFASMVSVLLGNGNGTFGAKTDYVTGTNPYSVAIGDLNGDAKYDVVVANASSSTVSVLLGSGDGTLGARADYGTGPAPTCVAIGDLNGDGKPDLAVADNSSTTVSVLLGNGNGTFGAKADYGTGNMPLSVAMGDLNGDGKLDLVTANDGANTVSVLLGNGDGTFRAKTDYGAGAFPVAVAVGDLNGDGKPDLAVVYQSSNAVSVLLGNGDGTFGAKADYGTGFTPNSVAIGDLNGDGCPDLAVANYASSTVSVLLSNIVPRIASIKDVPSDQGGKVHVLWGASPLDAAPSYGISSYNLWRRITTTSALQAIAQGAPLFAPNQAWQVPLTSRVIRATPQGTQSVYWEFVATVPARGQDGYGYMAATTSDSMAGGIPWNVFFVDAKNASNSAFYVSTPDSGYSVDNLPPGPPAQFAGEYVAGSNATVLQWAENLESDLSYYKLYRGSSSDFVPGAGNVIATKRSTGYTDAGTYAQYYKLSAVDLHGNESAYSLLTPSQTLGVADGVQQVFALEGARPNPARGQRFLVRFTLPVAAPARLELLDVSGRRVMAREVGSLGAGRHTIDLAEGWHLASGVYLVRLTQGTKVRVVRTAFLQ